MSKYYHSIQKILAFAPILMWVFLHLVISSVLVFTRDVSQSISYFFLHFILISIMIGIYGFWLFPALIEMGGRKKMNLSRFLLFTLGLIGLGFGIYAILSIILLNQFQSKQIPILLRFLFWFSTLFLGLIFISSTQLSKHYYNSKINKITIEADRIKAELSLLKNQINPHFLFNTLNNIYGLAYLEDAKAAEMISKLSTIMRYLLYDCDQQRVKLLKEKDLIENYLSLQQLKHDNNINVDFYHEGIKNEINFPPMILINFVENCFKHCDLETNSDAWIKISLEVENNEILFITENSAKKSKEKILFESHGIGLNNSRKLLEASFQDSYELLANNKDNIFKLKLKVLL